MPSKMIVNPSLAGKLCVFSADVQGTFDENGCLIIHDEALARDLESVPGFGVSDYSDDDDDDTDNDPGLIGGGELSEEGNAPSENDEEPVAAAAAPVAGKRGKKDAA